MLSTRSNMNLREFPSKQVQKRLISLPQRASSLRPISYSNVMDTLMSLITKPTKSGFRAPVVTATCYAIND